nr:unnamed protein product [Digitaria exilis]
MEPSPLRRRLRSPSPGAVVEPGGLDSLPPELLNEILSRLPLRWAVRTAGLSRAWRRRWESAPSLRFWWQDGVDPNAISGVLRRYSCPVRDFRHWHIGEASFRHSDRWLRLLALRGVRTLKLEFERSESDEESIVHTLHPSIFSCRGLTVLELKGCDIPTMPPGFTGFPNLTDLRLFNVDLPDGPRELEVLIFVSPLLEKLCLLYLELPDSHDEYLQWEIQAPKLQYLLINQLTDYGWLINELPSLEEAELDVSIYSTERDFVQLMTGLVHTKKPKSAPSLEVLDIETQTMMK